MIIYNNDQKIELPETLSIKHYQTLTKIGNPNTFQIISVLTGIPENELKELEPDNFNFLEKKLVPMLHVEKPSKIIFQFKHNDKEYGLVQDFFKLTMAEWVDLEVYSNGENILDNIHKIMAILYRPIVKKLKGNKYQIENYNSNEVEQRAEEFLDLPLEFYLSVSSFFFAKRNNIHKSFGGFFEVEEPDTNGQDEDKTEDKQDVKVDKNKTARFYWKCLMILCNDDITKMEQINNMNVILCLNYLSYKKDEAIELKNEMKKMQGKNNVH